MPRFRRRLMYVPYEQGRPIWVDDDRFDITYHVRLTALPRPGSWEQLRRARRRASQEQLLDRERPLWELWFVEGLEGGNVALLQKTHHALVDGVSGVDVATVLLDMTPDYVAPVVAGVDARARAERVAAPARHAARARRPSRPRSCGRSARCCAGRASALERAGELAQLDRARW